MRRGVAGAARPQVQPAPSGTAGAGRFHRSPASRARASAAAQTGSAAAKSPASISTSVSTTLRDRASEGRDVAGDLIGLPGQPHRLVQVAGGRRRRWPRCTRASTSPTG